MIQKRGGKRPNAGAKPKQEAEKVKPITIYAKNKLIDHYGSEEIKHQLTEVIRKLETNLPYFK